MSEFSRLPGIGRKTALRLVLHLLREDADDVHQFTQSVDTLCREVKHCKVCHNISDTEVCSICGDAHRDASQVCVVENIQDVMAVENTQQYHGLYHVLGGVISPLNNVRPEDLRIQELVNRVATTGVSEIIIATNPNLEGEATAMYISAALKEHPVRLSKLAGGLPVGSDLEYTDQLTLSLALENRKEFKGSRN